MSIDNSKAIAARAYALWDAAGQPDGEAEKFWHQAERQLATDGDASPRQPPPQTAEATGGEPRVEETGPAPKPKKRAPAKKKT